MHKSTLPLICLINRNFPPVDGATGYYAKILLERLEERGYRTIVVTLGEGRSTETIIYLKPKYRTGSKLKRLIGSYSESKQLISKAISIEADAYIVMTDPALLNYWASKRLKRQIWVLWSMDLYPEAFVANGLTSIRSPTYRYYQKVIRRGNPSYMLALGQNQLNYLRKTYYPDVNGSSLPIGLRQQDEGETDNDPHDSLCAGYVGNVGEAHDPQLIARALISLKSKGYRIILRCYGIGSDSLKHMLANHDIHQSGFLTESDLSSIDIHIVSLKKDWTHVCVPSKAISAVQSGNLILFIGEEESDTWQYLQGAGWRISSEKEIKDVINQINREEVHHKKAYAREVALKLEEDYEYGLSRFFAFLDGLKTTR